jgi:hypothetical protein
MTRRVDVRRIEDGLRKECFCFCHGALHAGFLQVRHCLAHAGGSFAEIVE